MTEPWSVFLWGNMNTIKFVLECYKRNVLCILDLRSDIFSATLMAFFCTYVTIREILP